MLYRLEWLTPHETPMGRTVADWVDGVRWLEENRYLRDPATMTWPADPEHPANQQMALQQKVCPPLCWRKRCKRAQRCVHFMPLAVREFMPELVVHLYNLHGEPLDYSGAGQSRQAGDPRRNLRTRLAHRDRPHWLAYRRAERVCA